jgi:GTPase SAR1 family protein
MGKTDKGRAILLGSNGVGKTCLINALKGKEFSDKYSKT